MHGIPTKAKSGPNPLSYYAYVAANAWLAMAQHAKLNPNRLVWLGTATEENGLCLLQPCGIVLLRLPSAIQALSLMKPVQMSITGSLGIWGGT